MRVVLVAAVVLLLLPVSGGVSAQDVLNQPTQISIQYREFVPEGGETAPTFVKIFERARKDCELVGTAFSRKCLITNVNIHTNPGSSGNMPGGMIVNANVTMMLPPPPVGASPAAR
jgi:hypothetical protein